MIRFIEQTAQFVFRYKKKKKMLSRELFKNNEQIIFNCTSSWPTTENSYETFLTYNNVHNIFKVIYSTDVDFI